ncbi:MAG: hypothetical protein V3W04_01200 [Gammaproteobacteria bacterium]
MDNWEDAFRTAFRGGFSGVLRWPQLDDLWTTIKKNNREGWYIYAIGTPPPVETSSAEDFDHFLNEVDSLLRTEHAEEFCGVVYVDSVSDPSFVKIFDPNNLGVSCGYSDNPPLPGWIISRLQPVDLQAQGPLPGNRRRWWQRLFSR